MVIPNTCGLTLRFPTNSSQTFACSGKWLHRYELFALKCKTIEVTHPTISRLWQKYKRRYDLKFLTANSMWASLSFLLWNIKHPRRVNDVRKELIFDGSVMGRNCIHVVKGSGLFDMNTTPSLSTCRTVMVMQKRKKNTSMEKRCNDLFLSTLWFCIRVQVTATGLILILKSFWCTLWDYIKNKCTPTSLWNHVQLYVIDIKWTKDEWKP